MSLFFENTLKFFTVTLIILLCIAGVYSSRGLYADGSYWLVEMLPRNGFYIFDQHRKYVQVLVQLPVALAIWFGTVDLNVLIRLHSFGFIGIPLIFWLGALALHFRSNLFWFFLVAFSVTYLRSNFFAAGEFNTTYGMTAFCAAILLREKLNFFLAILMLFTSFLLTHSYEATLFLGIFLSSLTAIRIFKLSTDIKPVRVVLIMCFLVFLISIYIGARSVFLERSYNGASTANLSALTELHFLFLALLPLLIFSLASNYFQHFKFLILIGVGLFVFVYLFYTFRWDQSNISYGFYSYAYRALCCFLLFFILSITCVFKFWPERLKANSFSSSNIYLSIAATMLFTSMAYLMFYHSYGYYKWLKSFEKEAIALKINTSIDKTSINTNHGLTYGYNWGWGNPSTSILLRGNAEALVLNSSKNHIGLSADGKGSLPGDFENIRENDLTSQNKQLDNFIYRLKPFVKNGRLFP